LLFIRFIGDILGWLKNLSFLNNVYHTYDIYRLFFLNCSQIILKTLHDSIVTNSNMFIYGTEAILASPVMLVGKNAVAR
jgi:hypothetical protein